MEAPMTPHSTPHRSALALAGLLLIAAPDWAAACAMLTHRSDTLAESDHQQAIFRVDDQGGSTVEYRVAWEGDPAAFGWIIAVPDSVTAVEDGDVARFEALTAQTAPRVEREGEPEAAEAGCACGPASKGDLAGGFGDTGANGVDLIDAGFTGTYSYSLVSADDSGALTAFLEADGFVLDPGAAENIAAYVADGGWAFALLRVETADTGGSLPPIRLRLSDQRLVFPARMGMIDGDRLLKTTWWVEGPAAATLDGWTSADLVTLQIDDQDADEAFLDALLAVGSLQTGALRTYVGDAEGGGTLTRFDAAVSARASAADARFRFADRGAFHATLEGRLRAAQGLALPMVGLGLGLFWRARRRSAPS
jgi:hypothetical protein